MMKNIINSFKYAGEGIISTFKSERNMKIHFCIMCIVIAGGVLLKISIMEWIVCIILFAAVIAGELINTAIENVIDMVMPERNVLAKKAKDAAAGAVLVLSIGAAIIGIIIFVPDIFGVIINLVK